MPSPVVHVLRADKRGQKYEEGTWGGDEKLTSDFDAKKLVSKLKGFINPEETA